MFLLCLLHVLHVITGLSTLSTVLSSFLSSILPWLGRGLPVAEQKILGLEFRFHSKLPSKSKIWGARSEKKGTDIKRRHWAWLLYLYYKTELCVVARICIKSHCNHLLIKMKIILIRTWFLTVLSSPPSGTLASTETVANSSILAFTAQSAVWAVHVIMAGWQHKIERYNAQYKKWGLKKKMLLHLYRYFSA